MKFWDSSAIVPLLVEDVFTPRLVSLVREDSVIVAWWGTPVECISALSRIERDGQLDAAAMNTACDRLRQLQESWHEIQPTLLVRETALRLLRVHPLRAADSLQLAAAILAVDHRPSQMPFVCNDDRLALAAQREGFRVLHGFLDATDATGAET